jgi:hypothetical protein
VSLHQQREVLIHYFPEPFDVIRYLCIESIIRRLYSEGLLEGVPGEETREERYWGMGSEVIALGRLGGANSDAVGKAVIYERREEEGLGLGGEGGGVGREDVGHRARIRMA